MPKRINPQDQWETDFLVPLPGEPRNIGPLEVLFQRLLNRTERLKNRIGAILGTAWDSTPPDTLAGLAGRVRTLENGQGGTTLATHRTAPVLDHPDGSVTEAKLADGAVTARKLADGAVPLQKLADTAFSANPTPNTLALRNAQGAVQERAVGHGMTILKVWGIYGWSGTNRWFRVARWEGFVGTYKSLSADLYVLRAEFIDIGSRLRVKMELDGSGVPANPLISLTRDNHATITNAVLIQTDDDTYELWAQFPWGRVYISGVVITGAGNIVLHPYGDVSSLVQNDPPSAAPGRLYLEWNTATVGQTFPGPGDIVAASRGTTSGYIRYDNGIQVCWATITVGSGTWTFPAAFASTPQVQATAQASEPMIVTITTVSTTAVGILRTGLSGNTVAGPMHLWAIGLWK